MSQENEPSLTPSAQPPGKSSGGGAMGLGAMALALLAKGKAGLGMLKLLPFGKLLLTSGSMFLSVLAYAGNRGWAFGLGFVVMIFIHELGHGFAMKHHGLRAGWPIFIPFFGAMIAMHDRPNHPRIEASVAYGGPLAGFFSSIVAAALGLWLHSDFFLSLAYLGFFINLFNMVPFGFLDGGRIARVISRRAWIVGALLLAMMLYFSPSPQLFMIVGLGAMNVFRRSKDTDLEAVTDEDRSTWSTRYFGLCALLGAGVYFSHSLLSRQGF
jgi:Zn-dependent protease